MNFWSNDKQRELSAVMDDASRLNDEQLFIDELQNRCIGMSLLTYTFR